MSTAACIYRAFLALRSVVAARSYVLSVIIGTPTFRASLNFVRQAGLGDEEAVRRLNADAVAMHREIRDRSDHQPIYIAGVIGPSGDAYRPEESLPVDGAREYHRIQAEALVHSGVDFLYAPTFPAVEEALGAAMAMGETGLPYVVSFVLERDGRVLDGTPLHAAIKRIDGAASPAPHFYSISCVHPSIAAHALRDEAASSDLVARRLFEFKANASPLSPRSWSDSTIPKATIRISSPRRCGHCTKTSACESSVADAAPTIATFAPLPPAWPQAEPSDVAERHSVVVEDDEIWGVFPTRKWDEPDILRRVVG